MTFGYYVLPSISSYIKENPYLRGFDVGKSESLVYDEYNNEFLDIEQETGTLAYDSLRIGNFPLKTFSIVIALQLSIKSRLFITVITKCNCIQFSK